MRLSLAVVLLISVSSLTAPVSAQRTLAQDTMSMSSPVAVTCGFCAMEAYGVLFTSLGGSRGLSPADFPLTVQSVSLALGAAEVTGTPAVCHGLATPVDPETLVHFELWAGNTLPDVNDIHALPVLGTAWPGEDLLITLDDVPVTMSVPTTDGGSDFNLMLNTLMLGDATMPAPVADGAHGYTYLRAVVGLGDGGNSSTCTPATSAPVGFPLRDDDGVVANHRSFLYANGAGWLWNEGAGVRGDWGIRLSIAPMAHADAGPVDGGGLDAGSVDASTALDGGGRDAGPAAGGGGSSCACRAGAPASGAGSLAALAMIALALHSRNVTRPKRAGTWKSPSSGGDQPAPH